ncbi:DUF3035 domain-containing protein [Algirhabdus cladophorae]|uniref:DUF3035 domain-containing protein n=1 Tax=Algirhabdus cladophorae TaxID=3377108 RepID=UPI003B8496FE
MRGKFGKLVLGTVIVLSVAACDRNKEPRLLNVKNTDAGPDEFGILPNKPLQTPENYSALPTPTPGGANLVDPTPNRDAVAALGGNPTRLNANGIPAGDGAIVNHASRYGRDATIRQRLASEDLEFRRRNDGRVLERLANVNVYFKAYRIQSLDRYSELERFRRLGVRTPAAPPEVVDE